MPLPSLKDIGTFITDKIRDTVELFKGDEWFFGSKDKGMTFTVGEGLSPEKTEIAQKKIREMIEVGKQLPESLDVQMSQGDAWRINATLYKKMKKGQALTGKDIVAGEFAGKAIEKNLINMVAGFMQPTSGMSDDAVKVLKKVSPAKKFVEALKKAKPIRGKQETLYTAERAKRLAESLKIGQKVKGEAGFFAEKAALKGELPKVQFESIRPALTQSNIDDLFIAVKNNPVLTEWEKLTAREGLAKMLGQAGGKVPTQGEINLLTNVFGDDFTKTILSKRPLLERFKEGVLQLVNIPRSILSSFDLSAPFRQGAFLINHPKRFIQSFKAMFKPFSSEKVFKSLQDDIIKRPSYKLMKEAKLSITELGRGLSKREEAFMSTWAEKIPLIGKGIRASERAYTLFLNKLRADVFDDLIAKATKQGLSPKTNKDLTKQIANFVNAATGRGSLGSLERAAKTLNTFFFSPRLMSSRLTLLNPGYYLTQHPFVRKEALKSLLTFGGVATGILTLAKLGGAEVETDPRSSDFAKIKIGNTRIDIGAGFQQYIRSAAQLMSGQYISSTTGKLMTLGEGYRPLTRYDILFRQIEGKEAPIFSFATDLLKGQNYVGEPIRVTDEIASRFVPMVIQDIVEIAKDDPDLLPIGVLGIFGVGLQTYKGRVSPTPSGTPSLKTPTKKMPSLKGVGIY